MPMVVPIPLAGMATEIGTANDALLELEMDRIGNYLAVGPATGQVLSSTTYTALPGWPNFQATLDVNGCLACVGMQWLDNSTSIEFEMQLVVDGSFPVVPYCLQVPAGQDSGLTVASSSNLNWFPGSHIPAGVHSFELQAKILTATSVTTYNPFIAILPL